MKKLLITLSFILLSFGAHNAFGQDIRWGVKGGINFAEAPKITEITDVLQSQARIGYHIGPMVEISIPILPLSIDAALLFASNSAELKDAADAWSKLVNTNYIELPINLKATVFSLGIADLMLIAGPSFNYMVSHNLRDLSNNIPQIGHFKANRFAVGLNAGIGIEVFNLLQITATYNATFSDTYKFNLAQATTDFIKAKNKGFCLSAAVLF